MLIDSNTVFSDSNGIHLITNHDLIHDGDIPKKIIGTKFNSIIIKDNINILAEHNNTIDFFPSHILQKNDYVALSYDNNFFGNSEPQDLNENIMYTLGFLSFSFQLKLKMSNAIEKIDPSYFIFLKNYIPDISYTTKIIPTNILHFLKHYFYFKSDLIKKLYKKYDIHPQIFPSSFLSLSKRFIKAYIQGMFDSQLYFSDNQTMAIYFSNFTSLYTFKYILMNLGFLTFIYSNNNSKCLWFPSSYAKKYYDTIGTKIDNFKKFFSSIELYDKNNNLSDMFYDKDDCFLPHSLSDKYTRNYYINNFTNLYPQYINKNIYWTQITKCYNHKHENIDKITPLYDIPSDLSYPASFNGFIVKM